MRSAQIVVVAMAILGSALVLRSAGLQSPATKPAGAVLTGKVLTTAGDPVRRAHVVVSGPATLSTDTDPDGMFRLDGLTKGTYTIVPAKAGFIETGPSVVNVAEGIGQLEVRVLMTPAGVITGRVVDRTGSGFADAPVSLLQGEALVSQLLTDDRGVFRFHTLRAGTYVVWAQTQNRDEAETVTMIPGRTADVQVVLPYTANSYSPSPSTAPRTPPEDPPVPGTRVIRGRITSAETGSPLSHVTVLLSGVGPQRTAETAESGRFLFTDVPDGRYFLGAAAIPKYVGLSYGQKTPQDPPLPVIIADGRQSASADIQLPQTKVLAGRVVDEFGDPAPGVNVTIVQSAVYYGSGKTMLLPVTGSGGPLSAGILTNDLGEFRIRNVPPGTLFLATLSGPFATNFGGLAGPETRGYGFAVTFYPGTAVPAEAQPVRVDVRGTTAPVTFALVPTDMGTVSGRVADRSGTPPRQANVILLQLHNGDVQMAALARATTDADGVFSIPNVPIGSFVVQAFGAGGFASAVVMVSPRETSTVQLPLVPPSAVRGRIVLDGISDPSLLKKIRISSFPTDFVRSPVGRILPTTVINDDGTFEVSGLAGINTLSFSIPAPWTLKSISSAGEDVTDRPIDSSAGDVNDLRVLFAPTFSTVVCKVSDKDGRPVQTGFVLIFPQDSARWVYPTRYLRGLTAEANGDFTTIALPPGAYRAVPFERVPRPDWMNPAFIETLRGLGESFTLGQGESVTVRLQLRK